MKLFCFKSIVSVTSNPCYKNYLIRKYFNHFQTQRWWGDLPEIILFMNLENNPLENLNF